MAQYEDLDLSPEALRYISSAVVLGTHDDNLATLLRMMKSGTRGLISYYEYNCSHWSYETLLKVILFMSKFSEVTQLLLTPRCFKNLDMAVQERYIYDFDASKDFNKGILGIYSSMSDHPGDKLKVLSLLEEFDPNAYIPTVDFLDFRDVARTDATVRPVQIEIQNLILSYLYRAIQMSSNPLKELNFEQIVRLLGEYAGKVYEEDNFAFFFIWESYLFLGSEGSSSNFFLDALKVIAPTAEQLYSDQTSTFYFLQRSIELSNEYPYGEEHLKVREKITDISLSIRELIKYVVLLLKTSKTPLETCRFFLGMENINKLQNFRGSLAHRRVHQCFTREESLLSKRKWYSTPIDGKFLLGPVDDEEYIMAMADHFSKKYMSFPVCVGAEPGGVVFWRAIGVLIEITNEEEEIIIIRNAGPSNDKKINFPPKILQDDLDSDRMLSLIKLITLLNFHFDSSYSLEEELLDKIYSSFTAGVFEEKELLETIRRLIWVLNVQPKYSAGIAKHAKQIRGLGIGL